MRTAKQRAALRKAQLASARKRRKRKSVKRQLVKVGLATAGVAGGVALVGAGVNYHKRVGGRVLKKDWPSQWGNGNRIIYGKTIKGSKYVGVRRKDKSYKAFIYKTNKQWGVI